MVNVRRHSKIDLHFWVMPNAGVATQALLAPHIQEFERQFPDVRVRLSIHPWSLAWSRLMAVVKGQERRDIPDVLQVGTTWVNTLSYLGALEAAESAASAPEPDGVTSGVSDPSPYSVPWFIDLRVLYYREDVFAALNLDPRLLQDWRGFHRICAELKRQLDPSRFPRLIAPLAMPGQKPAVLMHDLAPWIWSAGGDFSPEGSGEADLSQAALVTGCQYYFDLIDEGHMPIPNTALPQGNFFTGHYPMQFSGSWPVDTYLNPHHPLARPEVAENVAVAPLPAGPQGRFTFLGGSSLSVSSMGPNKDAAWEFVRFMTEPSRLLSHARSIGSLPPQLAGIEALFTRFPGAQEAFFTSFSHARRLPRMVELGSIEQIVYNLGRRVLTLVRERQYNHRRLHAEIAAANAEIRSLLSVHRYETAVAGAA